MSSLKKNTLLFFFCALAFLNVPAQNPGYMGKRAVIGYGLYLHPAFGNIVNDYSDRYINRQHEFFLEYAVAKKFSLGVSARLYNYTYNNPDAVYIGEGNSYNIVQETTSPTGSYKIKARSYSLYGKFFKANYLAPWGKYFILGLTLNRYTTTYDPTTMFVKGVYLSGSTVKPIISDFGSTTQYYTGADLYFGNGNSRIFANRIVVDYGYTIGFISTLQVLINLSDTYEEEIPEYYIENTSSKRLAALNRFNFFIKVGYLF